jgi:hypothetical protein
MEHDEQPRTQPRELRTELGETRREKALARYDAHPGIAIALLAVMAFLFTVVAYLFVSARVDNAAVVSTAIPHKDPLIGLTVFSSDGIEWGRYTASTESLMG